MPGIQGEHHPIKSPGQSLVTQTPINRNIVIREELLDILYAQLDSKLERSIIDFEEASI